MIDIELKSCPFCGYEKVSILGNRITEISYIICHNCLIEVSYDSDIEKAKKIWNMRVNDE